MALPRSSRRDSRATSSTVRSPRTRGGERGALDAVRRPRVHAVRPRPLRTASVIAEGDATWYDVRVAGPRGAENHALRVPRLPARPLHDAEGDHRPGAGHRGVRALAAPGRRETYDTAHGAHCWRRLRRPPFPVVAADAVRDGRGGARGLPDVVEVRLSMPNKHHFIIDLFPFGLENPNEVFRADDRPYGLIEAAVVRDGAPDPGPIWDPYPLILTVEDGAARRSAAGRPRRRRRCRLARGRVEPELRDQPDVVGEAVVPAAGKCTSGCGPRRRLRNSSTSGPGRRLVALHQPERPVQPVLARPGRRCCRRGRRRRGSGGRRASRPRRSRRRWNGRTRRCGAGRAGPRPAATRAARARTACRANAARSSRPRPRAVRGTSWPSPRSSTLVSPATSMPTTT